MTAYLVRYYHPKYGIRVGLKQGQFICDISTQ